MMVESAKEEGEVVGSNPQTSQIKSWVFEPSKCTQARACGGSREAMSAMQGPVWPCCVPMWLAPPATPLAIQT